MGKNVERSMSHKTQHLPKLERWITKDTCQKHEIYMTIQKRDSYGPDCTNKILKDTEGF